MEKRFISKIHLKNLRNIPECSINLPDDHLSHLIITGPNGSGKTTFLEFLYKTLSYSPLHMPNILEDLKDISPDDILDYFVSSYDQSYYKRHFYDNIKNNPNREIIDLDIVGLPDYYFAKGTHQMLLYHSQAHRKGEFTMPTGTHVLSENCGGNSLVQLLVNFKSNQTNAFHEMSVNPDDKEQSYYKTEYRNYTEWFDNFENALRVLLNDPEAKLVYDQKKFNFLIKENNKQAYNFSQLSDGYSAILRIVSDLMLSMSIDPVYLYKMPGIALIDEIETHLHVELQNKILPFMSALFPNIQFIVTTHSPFVLSSVKNAVIFDMKSRRQYEDFSQYSYSNIVEGYFNSSSYSAILLKRLDKAIQCVSKDHMTAEDWQFVREFDKDIEKLKANTQPAELIGKWLNVKLSNFTKLNGQLS